jgi:hemoglobin
MKDVAAQHKPSLYERLGGVYSIATVVDDFIDRIMIDPRLNANPRVDEAHHRVPPAGFKYLVTEMLCWAAGGPQRYTGRDMEEMHRHLLITAGEWRAFMDDLQQTLDKFKVPEAEQAEVKAIVDSTRSGIVVPEAAPEIVRGSDTVGQGLRG